MQSDKRAKCHPILNFTFSRHASHKYSGKTDDANSPDDAPTHGHPNNWGRRNLWEVIGKYDMLRVETHLDLNGILKPSDNGLVANTGVVLVCFHDFLEKVVRVPDRKKSMKNFWTTSAWTAACPVPDEVGIILNRLRFFFLPNSQFRLLHMNGGKSTTAFSL